MQKNSPLFHQPRASLFLSCRQQSPPPSGRRATLIRFIMARAGPAARDPAELASPSIVSLRDINLGNIHPQEAWQRGRVMHAASRSSSSSIQSHLSDSSRQGLGIHRVDSAASMNSGRSRGERRPRSWSPDAVLRVGWQPSSQTRYRKARDAIKDALASAFLNASHSDVEAPEYTAVVDRSLANNVGQIFAKLCCCFSPDGYIEHDGRRSEYVPPIATPLASFSSMGSIGASE